MGAKDKALVNPGDRWARLPQLPSPAPGLCSEITIIPSKKKTLLIFSPHWSFLNYFFTWEKAFAVFKLIFFFFFTPPLKIWSSEIVSTARTQCISDWSLKEGVNKKWLIHATQRCARPQRAGMSLTVTDTPPHGLLCDSHTELSLLGCFGYL